MAAVQKRGRPLDPEIDDAIVRAAMAAILEGGLQRMTVPGVAAAAGVAKTTVYRRYRTPVELALTAIGRLNQTAIEPETGSARTDLITLLEHTRERVDPTFTATVLVEARTHPEILDAAREQVFTPALERFRRALRKGIERGELRAGLDVNAAADAIFGGYFMHCYERGRPGPEWPAQAVDALWPAVTGESSGSSSARLAPRPPRSPSRSA